MNDYKAAERAMKARAAAHAPVRPTGVGQDEALEVEEEALDRMDRIADRAYDAPDERSW